jgi:hypothetical protein
MSCKPQSLASTTPRRHHPCLHPPRLHPRGTERATRTTQGPRARVTTARTSQGPRTARKQALRRLHQAAPTTAPSQVGFELSGAQQLWPCLPTRICLPRPVQANKYSFLHPVSLLCLGGGSDSSKLCPWSATWLSNIGSLLLICCWMHMWAATALLQASVLRTPPPPFSMLGCATLFLHSRLSLTCPCSIGQEVCRVWCQHEEERLLWRQGS